jgi:hypothetical protein
MMTNKKGRPAGTETASKLHSSKTDYTSRLIRIANHVATALPVECAALLALLSLLLWGALR